MACFNPRPPLLAGDTRRPLITDSTGYRFNPRPPLLAGDTGQWRGWPPDRHRFNPRPPLLAGDTSGSPGLNSGRMVSIRARHCWRAIPAIARHWTNGKSVSIRARHCWRAIPRCTRCTPGWRHCFNPRPPLLAGDTASCARLWFCLAFPCKCAYPQNPPTQTLRSIAKGSEKLNHHKAL